MAPLAPVEVIERRRRGDPIDAESVGAFMDAWIDGVAVDAQMAAWCMAAALEPPRLEEVDALARALVAAGERLDLRRLGATGDCQSTGAIGDAAALAALPLAAALGVSVATVAGASVGCYAGTLDRLDAIPGMRTGLSVNAFARCVRDAGCAAAAPGGRLLPASARFDALRDATATAAGVAPAVAVVMARAIAAGAESLVVRIPAGRGAAIADRPAAGDAAELATLIAAPWGRRVRAIVDEADGLAGRMIGPGLEVRAVAAVLQGAGDPPVRRAACAAAGALAELAGTAPDGDGPARAVAALDDGTALAAAERWVQAQGGEPGIWADPDLLPRARERRPVAAPAAGALADLDPRVLGEAARWAGAGRLHAHQVIDPAAGVEVLAAPGDIVERGQPVAIVHASDAWLADRARDIAQGGVRVEGEGADA